MTESELMGMLVERFRKANLLEYLSERQQQCLEMESGFFLEIVLKDGSHLSDAEKLVEALKAELKEKQVEIDAVVRAVWKVKQVVSLGAPPAESGGIKAATRFCATLESGKAEQEVEVDVSKAAEYELKRLGGSADTESLKRLVENFLALQLSPGGTSYWDPIRYRHQDIGPAAVSYLLHHSPMTAA